MSLTNRATALLQPLNSANCRWRPTDVLSTTNWSQNCANINFYKHSTINLSGKRWQIC